MQSERRKAYLKKYMKIWRCKNARHIKDYSKRYYRAHREERIAYVTNLLKTNREYYLRSLERMRRYGKKHRKERSAQSKIYQRTYRPKKIKSSPNYRMQWLLRARMHQALTRRDIKKLSTFNKLLGTTIDKARLHIEKQFIDGMSWDNHGKWHIDHIKPLASFDLTKLKEQRKAFHYTNMQPLWAEDNQRKGKRMMI